MGSNRIIRVVYVGEDHLRVAGVDHHLVKHNHRLVVASLDLLDTTLLQCLTNHWRNTEEVLVVMNALLVKRVFFHDLLKHVVDLISCSNLFGAFGDE